VDSEQDIVNAGDVKECFLLACERCIRKVFRCGRRSDRHVWITVAGQFCIGLANCIVELLGEGVVCYKVAYFRTDALQLPAPLALQEQQP